MASREKSRSKHDKEKLKVNIKTSNGDQQIRSVQVEHMRGAKEELRANNMNGLIRLRFEMVQFFLLLLVGGGGSTTIMCPKYLVALRVNFNSLKPSNWLAQTLSRASETAVSRRSNPLKL